MGRVRGLAPRAHGGRRRGDQGALCVRLRRLPPPAPLRDHRRATTGPPSGATRRSSSRPTSCCSTSIGGRASSRRARRPRRGPWRPPRRPRPRRRTSSAARRTHAARPCGPGGRRGREGGGRSGRRRCWRRRTALGAHRPRYRAGAAGRPGSRGRPARPGGRERSRRDRFGISREWPGNSGRWSRKAKETSSLEDDRRIAPRRRRCGRRGSRGRPGGGGSGAEHVAGASGNDCQSARVDPELELGVVADVVAVDLDRETAACSPSRVARDRLDRASVTPSKCSIWRWPEARRRSVSTRAAIGPACRAGRRGAASRPRACRRRARRPRRPAPGGRRSR